LTEKALKLNDFLVLIFKTCAKVSILNGFPEYF